jgi:hypothetical protein
MDKRIFLCFIFIIVLTAIEDVFIGVDSPYRSFVIVTQFIGVLFGVSAFSNYLRREGKYYVTTCFTAFIVMLSCYAVFSNMLFIQYPRVLYSLLPFYVFYNVAKSGVNIEKSLQRFSYIMVFVSIYQLYSGYLNRLEYASGGLVRHADNVAYQLLAIMAVITVLKPKLVNLILIGMVYIAILFSLKRGAMLSSTIVLVFYFFESRRVFKSESKFLMISAIATFLIGIPLLIRKYAEVLLHRFLIDESGGSGRESFYSSIFNDWLSFPYINQIVGGGFFSLHGGLAYAHSDWMQLLYDHGLFGVIMFSGIFISLFHFGKKIRIHSKMHYFPFLGICSILLCKSIFSGTYMTKYDAIVYGSLGLIIGIVHHKIKLHNSLDKVL